MIMRLFDLQKYMFRKLPIKSLLIIYLLVSNNLFAQNFHFGLKASPTINWMKPDFKDWSNAGLRMGFNYGIMTEFGFSENYSIATGVEISHRGGNLQENFIDSVSSPHRTISESRVRYRLQYLDIPLTIKMKTNEIGYIKYFGQFGVIPSFNLKAKGDSSNIKINHIDKINRSANDFGSNINPVNLGLLIGLGIEYSLAGKTALLLGISFNNGFTDILHDIDGNGWRYKAIGNSIAINTGIMF